ncbi:MAG TPA: hypothetical protein VFZ65_20230 [Planctomycetota bacterium]|nr:hypothetical protein [Planctomycetota bacterium]
MLRSATGAMRPSPGVRIAALLTLSALGSLRAQCTSAYSTSSSTICSGDATTWVCTETKTCTTT